jgi:L-malate glycosyltransferase
MRVLHLDTGRTWRGGQQQVHLLHRGLLERGIDSRLLARGELLERCRRDGLEARALPGGPWWNPRVVASVLATARNARPGLVLHTHDSHGLALAGVVRAMHPDVRLVCARRVSYRPGRAAGSAWKRRRVDAWIAVSGEIAAVLRSTGVPAEAVTVVHSAVEVHRLVAEAAASDRNALRRALDLPDDVPVIGLAGAFTSQKGHTVLLEAARAVLDRVPDAHFLLPGDGPLLPSIRAGAEQLGASGRFRFPGFRRDAAALISLFTVAVVPSVDGEGSAAAIKEPMALGVPVVASDLPGNLEVLGSAGLSFPVGDAAALAKRLLQLVEDGELRRRLAAAGRERVAIFSPSALIDATLSVYRRLGP